MQNKNIQCRVILFAIWPLASRLSSLQSRCLCLMGNPYMAYVDGISDTHDARKHVPSRRTDGGGDGGWETETGNSLRKLTSLCNIAL